MLEREDFRPSTMMELVDKNGAALDALLHFSAAVAKSEGAEVSEGDLGPWPAEVRLEGGEEQLQLLLQIARENGIEPTSASDGRSVKFQSASFCLRVRLATDKGALFA